MTRASGSEAPPAVPDPPGASEEGQPDAVLQRLADALGHRFERPELLRTAVTHASYAHENPGAASNERLEFLGDSVIGMVVAHLLYDAHPEWSEGDLTRGLHKLVDRRGLASLARQLDLGTCLRLGRTEVQSGGDRKDSILADGIEAVLAALYLDGGLAPVVDFARRVFASALVAGAPRIESDPKTGFQEWVMAEYGVLPEYRTVADTEVEGGDDRFTVEVIVGEEVWGVGSARSKRAAQRAAAIAACASRDARRGLDAQGACDG